MWINRAAWASLLCEVDRSHDAFERLADKWDDAHGVNQTLVGENLTLAKQKTKDDVTIDWLRHRVNALEKQNAVLLQKVSGVAFPTPEIASVRPGTMSADFDHMPSFEDMGDDEAARLGISLDESGQLKFAESR